MRVWSMCNAEFHSVEMSRVVWRREVVKWVCRGMSETVRLEREWGTCYWLERETEYVSVLLCMVRCFLSVLTCWSHGTKHGSLGFTSTPTRFLSVSHHEKISFASRLCYTQFFTPLLKVRIESNDWPLFPLNFQHQYIEIGFKLTNYTMLCSVLGLSCKYIIV